MVRSEVGVQSLQLVSVACKIESDRVGGVLQILQTLSQTSDARTDDASSLSQVGHVAHR